MWGGACLRFLGNRKCLKQSFHYKINKNKKLLQYMYIEIFVFYLPYIPKKNQQKNMSHAIATTEDILYFTFTFCFKDFVSQ